MVTNKVTVVIKAFERPDALQNLYASIRKFYPDLKVIIVDDSKQAMDANLFDENVEYIHADFDIGLSAGRNLAIKHVKTKYFLLLDDDFLFTKNTKLEKMLEILETTDFKVVSGGVCDFGKKMRRFTGIFKVKNDILYLMEGRHKGKHQGYKNYEFTINFFMADTQTIVENPWDEHFKVGEHEDFFYNLTKKKVLITDISQDVWIEHYPQELGDYFAYKNRVWEYLKDSAKKNGVKEIKKVLKVNYQAKVLTFIRKIPIIGITLKKLKDLIKGKK